MFGDQQSEGLRFVLSHHRQCGPRAGRGSYVFNSCFWRGLRLVVFKRSGHWHDAGMRRSDRAGHGAQHGGVALAC